MNVATLVSSTTYVARPCLEGCQLFQATLEACKGRSARETRVQG